MKDNLIMIGMSLFLIAFCACFMYGGFLLQKKISWWLEYEDMTIETIQEYVKPECLIGDTDG